MLPEESRGRQEKLGRIIYELSEKLLSDNEDETKQFLKRLQIIYEDGFKHNYSDLFPVITDILREDNEYNIEYLSNNLDRFRTYLEKAYLNGSSAYSDIDKQFTKLCDHLNLQMSQLNYIISRETSQDDLEKLRKDLEVSNGQIIKSVAEMDEASKKLEESNKKVEESNKKLEESNERADGIQTQLITILGIFAAIIIAFSGGLTLLGNSITAIHNAEHYESVVLVAIICGMVMFNTIFLMMYYVAKLTERDMFAKCKAEICAQCKETKCKGIEKIRKRMPYVFWYNFLSLAGVAIDLAIWFLDIKGYLA